MPANIAERRRIFRDLHESGCFVIPNPWDAGSARYLQHLGFKALATTSSGCAWALGLPDNAVGLEAMLAHLGAIVRATTLPVNADFENGYGATPREVARNVRLATETGIAGVSIEDSTGDAARPLFTIDEAVVRLRAARRAIDEAGADVMLVGRAENLWLGDGNVQESIARLKAYAGAGADCLYAPGTKTREQIEAIVKAVAPKPVNVLVGSAAPFTLRDLESMGVRRVSVGGALARAAWTGFLQAAREISEQGTFGALSRTISGAQINGLFREQCRQ